MPRVDADGNPISCTWFTLDGQARGGCFRRGSRRLGCRRRDAGNGEDAGPEEEEDDPGGSWFGSPAVDPLDACEKGETCQAEPWLGGLWGSKMVRAAVRATAAVRAAVEQPAAPPATGSDSVAIVGRVTRQQETIHAAAANAAKTLAGLQLAQKDPGPQRCSQQEQAQRLLGKSPSPDGKWRGAPLASDLEVFLSDPDVVNKDVLKSKGGAGSC
jgi:hypothetical protein